MMLFVQDQKTKVTVCVVNYFGKMMVIEIAEPAPQTHITKGSWLQEEGRYDELGNDCDGEINEEAVDAQTRYLDQDGDGFGVTDGASTQCDEPFDGTTLDGDCDGMERDVNPGVTEICNGVDDNCHTLTGEGFDSDNDEIADCFDAEECGGLDNDGDGETDEEDAAPQLFCMDSD